MVFLSTFGTRGFHEPCCGEVAYRLPRSPVPRRGTVGDTRPLARAAHVLSEARCFLCLPRASRESPSLLHLGRAAKAGSAGSRSLLSRLAGFASSPGMRASQVGSCCRIRVCGVIKTCKVVPSSPFRREAGGLAGAGITAPPEVVLVPAWVSRLRAVAPLASLVGHCQFYPSQICSPGEILVPVQCRWLKPH